MARERTVTLGAERERLADQHDAVLAQDGAADADAIRYGATELAQRGAAVAGLIEEYGADAEVTVRGLTAGRYARVEDRVATHRQRRDDLQAARGYHRNVYAAAGLVDAPFFDRDAAADRVGAPNQERAWADLATREQLDAAVAVVADQPPGVVKWLHGLVDDVTGGPGNWKPSSEQPTTANSSD